MRSLLSASISMLLCAFFLGVHAQGTATDHATSTFPREVRIDYNGKQYDLALTGEATRKKLFIKVYNIASYLQKGASKGRNDILQAIMNDNNAKQVTMKWLRGIGPDKIQETYRESIHNSIPNPQGQTRNDIEKFLSFFNRGVNKGDTTVIKWLPGGYIEVDFNGNKVGSVVNKDLAIGLWSVWFGEKGPVNRESLLSQ